MTDYVSRVRLAFNSSIVEAVPSYSAAHLDFATILFLRFTHVQTSVLIALPGFVKEITQEGPRLKARLNNAAQKRNCRER